MNCTMMTNGIPVHLIPPKTRSLLLAKTCYSDYLQPFLRNGYLLRVLLWKEPLCPH